jgi:hypothetical protein
VLEPVSTAGLTLDDLDDLRRRVRTMIVEARDELHDAAAAQ